MLAYVVLGASGAVPTLITDEKAAVGRLSVPGRVGLREADIQSTRYVRIPIEYLYIPGDLNS